MKAILFDIDGVLIKSDNKKREIIYNTLDFYNILEVEGVREVIELGLNREAYLQKIYDIIPFDKQGALDKINHANFLLENNPNKNDNVIEFIKNNSNKYLFFTNTSLSESSLKRVLKALGITEHFHKLLAFDNGNKIENINYVVENYDFKKEEILFIDDNIKMIDFTKNTGVHLLHFNNFDIDIQEHINKL